MDMTKEQLVQLVETEFDNWAFGHLEEYHINLSEDELRYRLIIHEKQSVSSFIGDADEIMDMVKMELIQNISYIQAWLSTGQEYVALHARIPENISSLCVSRNYTGVTHPRVYRIILCRFDGAFRMETAFPLN